MGRRTRRSKRYQHKIVEIGFDASKLNNFPLERGIGEILRSNAYDDEIVALREACQRLQNYRLPLQTTLYVTLEPCTMCIGALIHARVDRLVYAASEPRAGMVGSQMDLSMQPFYNHNIQVHRGLCSEHSSQLLKTFFRERRRLAKQNKNSV